jgi:outer membrane protein OmpA-like peptidoglycan-associated protein
VKTGKLVLFALVWLVILAVGVSIWKLVIQPMKQTAQQQQQQAEQEDILNQSTGTSIYKDQIAIAADGFSGYAVLRSPEFTNLLAQQGIRLKIEDDAADYDARLQGLADGKYAMAAFPIDALIKASAKAKLLPATVLAIIDESRGADAIVANKTKYADVNAINNAESRFVLVGDSPSETLARVVLHDFELPSVAADPFVSVASPDEILGKFRIATPTSPQLYVTWEPYVSQLLAEPNMHIVVDSSRFTGYVVDALVVSRAYLMKNQVTVEKILEAYFRALYSYSEPEAMIQLVMADAKETGAPLTIEQAKTLVNKVQWKNTQENFAHLGLREGKVLPLENMIERIMNVLLETKAIEADPTGGQLNKLFYDPPMAQLKTRDFHPGLSSEAVAEQKELPPLSDEQWSKLVSVGTLSVPDLVFARGSSQLNDVSRSTLDALSEKLQSWPSYYLQIRGSATKQGDTNANRELAAKRAQAAQDYLTSQGISLSRMQVIASETDGKTRVSFELGQLPY